MFKAPRARFALLLSFSVLALSGCGKESEKAAPFNSMMTDLGFEGAFVSKSIECVDGRGRRAPVSRGREIRRSLLIVSDRVLVTDQNSVGFLSGNSETKSATTLLKTVSRYYEVKTRAPVGRERVRIELAQPADGTVSVMASSFAGKSLGEDHYHPMTRMLKSANRMTWDYAANEAVLQVLEENVPESVCGERGADLFITFEKRQFN